MEMNERTFSTLRRFELVGELQGQYVYDWCLHSVFDMSAGNIQFLSVPRLT